jgi:hypothetical protein
VLAVTDRRQAYDVRKERRLQRALLLWFHRRLREWLHAWWHMAVHCRRATIRLQWAAARGEKTRGVRALRGWRQWVRRCGAVQAMRERADRITMARVVDAWWLALDAVAAADRRQARHSRHEAGSYEHQRSFDSREAPRVLFATSIDAAERIPVTLGQTMHLSEVSHHVVYVETSMACRLTL